MISVDKYEEILNSGLSLDHYFILYLKKQGSILPKNNRIQGFVNVLSKKGYLDKNEITQKGIDILGIEKTSSLQDIFEKCKERVKELTGKSQVIDRIHNKPYPFLPNFSDFEKTITRFIKEYKFSDFSRIENCLIKYIETCNDSKSWFPILKYYILKDRSSRLMTDIELDAEEISSYKSSQKLV